MPQVISPSEQGRAQSLYTSATYDGRPGTIAAARDLAAGFLAHAQGAGGADITAHSIGIARLVVSELVTNALKHAPGPCLLDLEIDGDSLQITVSDTGTALPAALPHDADRIGRHGLEIVLALCRRLEVDQRAGGKCVRAHVDL
ncbi:ATP-binding protein [Streptomyces sp. 8N706]|uniref:ATP-binding protein n=1 Tax=Streptomyces sp. 8N706 TaxID=3457416 RepID=UPI003FD170AF